MNTYTKFEFHGYLIILRCNIKISLCLYQQNPIHRILTLNIQLLRGETAQQGLVLETAYTAMDAKKAKLNAEKLNMRL